MVIQLVHTPAPTPAPQLPPGKETGNPPDASHSDWAPTPSPQLNGATFTRRHGIRKTRSNLSLKSTPDVGATKVVGKL